MKIATVHVCACACVCVCMCMCVQQVMHRVCLGGAWHGTKWAQCVKHAPFDQNMLNMFNQE